MEFQTIQFDALAEADLCFRSGELAIGSPVAGASARRMIATLHSCNPGEN